MSSPESSLTQIASDFRRSSFCAADACLYTAQRTDASGAYIVLTQADAAGFQPPDAPELRLTTAEWRAHVLGIMAGEAVHGVVEVVDIC